MHWLFSYTKHSAQYCFGQLSPLRIFLSLPKMHHTPVAKRIL